MTSPSFLKPNIPVLHYTFIHGVELAIYENPFFQHLQATWQLPREAPRKVHSILDSRFNTVESLITEARGYIIKQTL